VAAHLLHGYEQSIQERMEWSQLRRQRQPAERYVQRVNAYTWDAYGNLASANAATIVYDAFSRMVENQNGTYEFAYAPTGTQPLAWLEGQTLAGAHLPLPGGAFAVYNGSGIFQYNHADWLGSARLFSTPTRTASMAMSYAPFGEGYASGIQDIQFTSYSSSFTVSGNESQGRTLDDFTFRRYSPVQGRWISPDPAGLGAVDPTNPQSWNRYAYVANNPLSYVDPLGLQIVACPPGTPDGTICVDVNGGGDDGSGGFGSDGGDPCFLYGMNCPGQGPTEPGGGGGGGGGNTGNAPKKTGMAVALPPTDPCQQKAQNIQNLRDEILGRSQDYSDNAFPLPLFGPMSRAGHVQQISDKQTALQNALNDYRTSGCGGPSGNAGLPADVNQVAFAPLPALSPSRFSVPSWVAPTAVLTGGVACAIFVPGCFEVELATAPAW
jgi:RHS repeat-associated protein